MSRAPRRLVTHLETMERRDLLSGLPPILSMGTYDRVAHELADTLGQTLATKNVQPLDSQLAAIAGQVPHGKGQLLPDWTQIVQLNNPTIPISAASRTRAGHERTRDRRSRRCGARRDSPRGSWISCRQALAHTEPALQRGHQVQRLGNELSRHLHEQHPHALSRPPEPRQGPPEIDREYD